MKEGYGSGQHGEDRVLNFIFKDQPTGLVVDVGSADGYLGSNSFGLLCKPGWDGILIEPEPKQFQELKDRYKNREGVICINCAVGTNEGVKTFYCGGQVSTFVEDVKKSAEVNYGIKYIETKVEIKTLSRILEEAKAEKQIDFLSIDAEGMNYDVWQSLNPFLYSPRVVCIEGTGYVMIGYKELCRVGCNTFYLREDLCVVT
jgi:FkbM family methyltransferase